MSVKNSLYDLALREYQGLTTSQTIISGLVIYSILISSGKNSHSISTVLTLDMLSNSTLKETSFLVLLDGKYSENQGPLFGYWEFTGHGNLAV